MTRAATIRVGVFWASSVVPCSMPIGQLYGVNRGCLDDVADEVLAALPVTYVDGRSDRWQSPPALFAHL